MAHCYPKMRIKKSPATVMDMPSIDDKTAQYRRTTDGVVVDKLGIPFVKGQKDHHTWVAEQEGIYNYDIKQRNEKQQIKDALTKEQTPEKRIRA